MAKYPGLMRRGTKWYLRLRVPADLMDEVGKKEIWRTLGTGDYGKAVSRYKMVLGEVEALLESARRRRRGGDADVSDAELRRLVSMWFGGLDRTVADIDHGRFGDARREALATLDEDIGVLVGGAEEQVAPAVQKQADALLGTAGVVLDKAGDRYAGLCADVRRAMLETARRSRSRIAGEPAGRVFDPAFAVPGVGAEPRDAGAVTLAELVERFLDDPAGDRGAKAAHDYRVILRYLTEFVPKDTPVGEVTRDHCRQVAALLKRMPANASKRKALRRLRPLQAAAQAGRLGLSPMSPTTANSYIGKMSGLFRWAAREGLVDRNVAERLMLPEDTHRRDARLPFSEEQLRTILRSDVFHEPRDAWDHRQWVFVLSLYGGLRLNEACGLECGDVETRDGVPCVLVRPDEAGRKRLKTRAAHRTVPVHPELVRLGFLDFVERQRAAGHAVLFPDLRPDRRGYLSDGFQKWFGRHLRKIGADAPRTSFHSTRHCFRDALREAAAPRDVVLALGGWAGNGGTADDYGGGLRPRTLARWVRRIDYGIDLGHLLQR